MVVDFLNSIADDFIIGLATSFSDRSQTEQLKRNIKQQIDNINNPLVKMFVENNIDSWINMIEGYANPLVGAIQKDPPRSVDIARDIIKDNFSNRVDSIADKIKEKLMKEKQ